MHRLRTVLGLVAALGCASHPANTIAAGHEGAPGIERFLVCAPNAVLALPNELQAATRPVRDQIDAYLQFHGRKAQWVDLYEAKRLWNEAMTEAKEAGRLADTPVFFAKRLDELYDFDAIVMPSLVVHQVKAISGYASWDGVDRQIRIVKEDSRAFRRDDLSQQVAQAGPTGDFMVTSVHVMVFAPSGQRIFEGRGGIEFVQEVDLRSFRKRRKIEFPVRSDLPGSLDSLREGIAIAFDPYLAMPEE